MLTATTRSLGRRLAFLWRELVRERVPQVGVAVVVVVALGALAFFLFERGGAEQAGDPAAPGLLRRVGNSLWWSVVTFHTEGYGDYTAKTAPGRVVGVIVMASGVVLMSLITAVISSIMVTRRIREGQGLQPIRTSDHIILCGWNENGAATLAGLAGAAPAPPSVALVSEIDEDAFHDLQFKFRGRLQVEFVYGDFTSESVLERAGLARARGVIVLADVSGEHSIKEADERAIRAVLAAKGMAPAVPLCVEILKPDNERPLRRARADEIVIRGRHTGYFLAAAMLKPGVPEVLNRLLSVEGDVRLEKRPVPAEFADRTFGDLARHFLDEREGLLIGLVAEKAGIKLDDLLAGDMSSIDQFIKRKFAEAGKDLSEGGPRMDVRLYPAVDARVGEHQIAILIVRPAA